MKCSAAGDPAPIVTWSTPTRGHVAANSSTLKLKSVTKAETGR